MLGGRLDGTKELIAVEDGYRESTESWATLLRNLKRRGLEAPVVAVGDGALGFWAAVRDVWPETREQRDWCHKMVNILDKLPRRLHAKVKRALREIMYAETREQADEQLDRFARDYEAKYPKAVACLVEDREPLLAHFAFPAEHWIHLRTTNPVESPFSTVRLRRPVTKGAGSRKKGRGFTEADDGEGADRVVVVNQTMASTVWRDRDALNQCLFIGANSDNCARVIGVVTSMRDQRELTDQTLAMQYYVPVNQDPYARSPRTLIARMRSGDTQNHIAAVRRALHDLHPAIRYVTVNPLREVVDPMYRSWTLGATMFTVFGGLALSIAVVGMYSLLAFNVARRKHELGIRVALGADRTHIVKMVLGQAMALVAGGLAIGASVSLAAGGAIEPLLFQVSARDPLVFAAVIGTLGLAGIAAAVIPARRATAVDPLQTMRVE